MAQKLKGKKGIYCKDTQTVTWKAWGSTKKPQVIFYIAQAPSIYREFVANKTRVKRPEHEGIYMPLNELGLYSISGEPHIRHSEDTQSIGRGGGRHLNQEPESMKTEGLLCTMRHREDLLQQLFYNSANDVIQIRNTLEVS